MPFSSPALLSRRNLLIAGTLGVSSLATAATIAPAAAADDDWSQEFMTRAEDRQGFRVDDMDEWQTANARFILAVAAGHGIDAQGAQIALITAIVEAGLYNYEPAVDADSGGLFQQRPSMGWGSDDPSSRSSKPTDALVRGGPHSQAAGLLQISPDYRQWGPGAAAQEVQRPAHPGRYAEQWAAAETLWERHAHDVEPYRH